VPARSRRFPTAEQAHALSLILAGMQRKQAAGAIDDARLARLEWFFLLSATPSGARESLTT